MNNNQIFALCLRPGNTCLDVGANIGMSAEVMSKLVGPTGSCISFECHPVHFARLAFLATRPGFENIRPHLRALSNNIGYAILFFGSDPAVSQASTIVPALANHARLGTNMARLKIETDTLDHFCENHRIQPDVIKIDVEGAESQVFDGARHTIASNLPHLIFEFGFGLESGHAPEYLIHLGTLGYEFYVIDLTALRGKTVNVSGEERILFSASADELGQLQTGGNLLAIHKSKSVSLLSGIAVHKLTDAEPHLAVA